VFPRSGRPRPGPSKSSSAPKKIARITAAKARGLKYSGSRSPARRFSRAASCGLGLRSAERRVRVGYDVLCNRPKVVVLSRAPGATDWLVAVEELRRRLLANSASTRSECARSTSPMTVARRGTAPTWNNIGYMKDREAAKSASATNLPLEAQPGPWHRFGLLAQCPAVNRLRPAT